MKISKIFGVILVFLMIGAIITKLDLSCRVSATSTENENIFSALASTIPSIDGKIFSGEWEDADFKVFYMGPSKNYRATFYIKNDFENLYVAFEIEGVTYGPDTGVFDAFSLVFDNDNDGELHEEGDDVLNFWIYFEPDFLFFDGFYSAATGDPAGHDHLSGGSNDGEGYWTHTNPTPNATGNYIFELSHPLDSNDDSHDFSLKPGDSIGFYIFFYEAVYGPSYPHDTKFYWQEEWPEDKHAYYEIKLKERARFWVEVHGTGSNLAIRQDPGTGGEERKRVPDGWVLKVIDTHGNNVVEDGYEWWEVKDVTDGIEGWSASQYLKYDESRQEELKGKTKEVISVYYDLPGKDFRFKEYLREGDEGKEVAYLQVILKEEDCFSYAIGGLGAVTTDATGYFGTITKDSVVSFQSKYSLTVEEPGVVDKSTIDKLNALLDEKYGSLIEDKYSRKSRASAILEEINDHSTDFPVALILAIVLQESEIMNFNNEVVALTPWGRGILQIDSDYYVGSGSLIRWFKDGKVDYCRGMEGHDCTCSDSYCYCEACKHYYTNTIQGIEANVKDGLYALKNKYTTYCSRCYDATESAVLTDEGLYKDELGNGVVIYSKREKCMDRHGNEYGNRIEKMEIDAIEISYDELKIIFAVWGYNSLSVYKRDEHDPCTRSDYLRCVANKLSETKSIFGHEMPEKDRWITSLKAVANKAKTMIEIKSSGYVQALDPEGRITGLVDNEIMEEIPFSFCDEENDSIIIPFSYSSFYYRVIGTKDGTYGLEISHAKDEKAIAFSAIDIPILVNSTHQYTIDWSAISQGAEGVTVQVDSDYDGVFEQNITSNAILQPVEIEKSLPQIIQVKTVTDKPQYKIGEKVMVKSSVTNIGSEPISIIPGSSFTVYNQEGRKVYAESIYDITDSLQIQPEKTVTGWQFIWPQTDKDSTPVLKGSYDISTEYDGVQSDKVRIEIEDKIEGCIIATALYGSPLEPEVCFLRHFRDYTLVKIAGEDFVSGFNSWYYSFSPEVAQFIDDNPWTRIPAIAILSPLIWALHVVDAIATVLFN